DEVLGLLRIRSQVQIGIEDLALAQHLALDRLRLLHFDDHVGLGEDLFWRRDELRTCGLIVFIGGTDTQSSARLDPDLVAVAYSLTNRERCHAHPVFVILDLFRNANQHDGKTPKGRGDFANAPRSGLMVVGIKLSRRLPSRTSSAGCVRPVAPASYMRGLILPDAMRRQPPRAWCSTGPAGGRPTT